MYLQLSQRPAPISVKRSFKTLFTGQLTIIFLLAASLQLSATGRNTWFEPTKKDAFHKFGIPLPPKGITGKITGENAAPLFGASIKVRGRAKTALSDQNGNFSIDANTGETLEISFIGYKTTYLKVSSSSNLLIKMEVEVSEGDEVVVVGYGTQKKRAISGTVTTISKEQLENRPINNLVQGLQGLAPDLVITRNSGQPGNEGWNMQLRGISSINGANNPLVIVDGVEYADLTLLNPTDIETLTVLADASSSAIYGAKAANGVLLITTKTGKAGKIKFNYNGLYQIKHPLATPEIIPYWQGWSIQQLAIRNASNLAAPDLDPVFLNLLKTAPGYIINDGTYNTRNYFNVDYVDLLIQKYYSNMSHNVGISGGSENNKYFIGLGLIKNDGILKVGPDDFTRHNVRFNLTSKFNNTFSLDSRIAYSGATTMSAGGTPNVSGDYGLLYNIYNLRNNVPFTVPGYTDRYYGNSTYPILKEGGYNKKAEHIFEGTFTLSAKNILPGLVLSSMFSPRIQQTNVDDIDKPVYAWSPSPASNPAAPLYDATVPLNWVQSITPIGGTRSQVSKSRTTQVSYTANALADYTKSIGHHHFHALAGFQYQYYNYDLVGLAQSNLLNNDLPTVNFTSNATTPNDFVRDFTARNTMVSYFGRINYDYKNKYYIELNVRNDASSRLAPGYQSKTYPGVSAAWRISQEAFFQNVNFVDELKIRGSWGQLGNALLSQNPWQDNYLAYPTLSSSTYPFNGTATNGLYLNTLASGALGWEIITTKGIGIDFTILKKKLSGSFDIYNKANDNMLIAVPLPGILGIGGSTTNSGSMVTKGWGLNISWKDNLSNGIQYRVGFNLSDNVNKLVAYSGTTTYGEGINRLILGMPINTVWGYQALGYFSSKDDVTNSAKQFNTTIQGPGDIRYADINGDGLINAGQNSESNHGDLVNYGTTNPRYSYGFNLGISWKNFDFSALFQGVGKRTFVIYPLQMIPFMESWRYPWANYIDNYWTPERQTGIRFPRPVQNVSTTNNRINSSYLQNGAYLRLKNVQFGYTFKDGFVKKIKASSIRVYFSGQDIWTMSKAWFKYFDPESANQVVYPYQYTATYAFGIDVNF